MKTVKRIIAVFILIVIIALVGYSCYTGSQLKQLNESEVIVNES